MRICCVGNVFTEPLPSNDRGIHIQRVFKKYAVEMGSGAMVYVRSFIETGSGIQQFIWRINSHTGAQPGDLISLLYFFEIRKVG
jgi:hypothetical protein